jgi:transcriptional regulator with GAF, ATPase, and Fis domain
VDRFFDRDRAAYRVAVREISEAMVSMLSLNEIADRILVALTDTMGVERAMVLIVDDEGKLLRPIASRGDWDDHALATEIPSHHAIWKHLWMRREDLSRVDFDDEPDVENREACRDVFDTLEVEILVPILYGVDLLGIACCCERSPTRARSRSRTPRPSTRSPSSTRRWRPGSRSGRGSCARPRRSSRRLRR